MQNLGASQCWTNVLVRCLGYLAVWWFRLLFLLLVFLFRLNLFFSEASCGSQQPICIRNPLGDLRAASVMSQRTLTKQNQPHIMKVHHVWKWTFRFIVYACAFNRKISNTPVHVKAYAKRSCTFQSTDFPKLAEQHKLYIPAWRSQSRTAKRVRRSADTSI